MKKAASTIFFKKNISGESSAFGDTSSRVSRESCLVFGGGVITLNNDLKDVVSSMQYAAQRLDQVP